MNSLSKLLCLFVSITIFQACNNKGAENDSASIPSNKTDRDSVDRDSISLKESFNEIDVTTNAYLNDLLIPIRENFKRLNSIANWTKIDIKELQESTEGGQAKFITKKNAFKKLLQKTMAKPTSNFQNIIC